MATENSGNKLTSQNINAILIYACTLGIGAVATQTFMTAGKVNTIEGAQVTRNELETKLGNARAELTDNLKGVAARQEKITETLGELRVEIARIPKSKNVDEPNH